MGLVLESPKNLSGPEKSFLELRPTVSVKLVFSYVVKVIKIKISATFRTSRRHGFEDTKRICHPKCTRKVSVLSRDGPQDLKLSCEGGNYGCFTSDVS